MKKHSQQKAWIKIAAMLSLAFVPAKASAADFYIGFKDTALLITVCNPQTGGYVQAGAMVRDGSAGVGRKVAHIPDNKVILLQDTYGNISSYEEVLNQEKKQGLTPDEVRNTNRAAANFLKKEAAKFELH